MFGSFAQTEATFDIDFSRWRIIPGVNIPCYWSVVVSCVTTFEGTKGHEILKLMKF